jgi:16S rRNA (cytosine967-C5)-methyltransferase
VGFINAILRRLAGGEAPPLPDLKADPVAALSVATAHPAWLTARWLSRFGLEETQARFDANNQTPPLTVRVNTLKTDAQSLIKRLDQEGVKAAPCRYSPVGLIFEAVDQAPAGLASHREGLWLFQDEAAQLASLPAAPEPRSARSGNRRRPGGQDHPSGRNAEEPGAYPGRGQPPRASAGACAGT